MLRFLYITPLAPAPAHTGSRQRTKLLFEALARMGEVDLFLHSPWWIGRDAVAKLQADFNLVKYLVSADAAGTVFGSLRLFLRGASDTLAKNFASRLSYYSMQPQAQMALRELIRDRNYNLLVCRYFRTACRTGIFDYTHSCIDVDDVDSDQDDALSKVAERSYLWRRIHANFARQLRILMSANLPKAAFAWVTKDADRKKLAMVRTFTLPNAVDASSGPQSNVDKGENREILFVGSLSWPPNQDGLIHFLQAVWPSILEECPDVTLRVVGAELTEKFARRLRDFPRVMVAGYVENLAAAYAESLFSIVPVYFGAGTHIKVIESLHYAKTCVVTEFAVRGYEDSLISGESILVSNSDRNFANHCVNLLRNTATRRRLGLAGRVIVEKVYSRDAFFGRVRSSIEGAMDKWPNGKVQSGAMLLNAAG